MLAAGDIGGFAFKPPRTHRPTFMGQQQMVASGHYLASMGGFRLLEGGGNAVDAGVAAGICINVLQPDMTNFGGVAPIILYRADLNQVHTVSGLGRWPKRASVAYFQETYGGDLPDGLPRTVTPAAASAWLTALEHFGTRSFAQVVAPALELAEDGYPVHQFLFDNVSTAAQSLRRFPLNDATFFPGGRQVGVGERLRQPDLARTFRRLIEVEARAAASGGREAGLRAAREYFYQGDIAREIDAFCREQGALLEYEDLASFAARVEQPVTTSFHDYDVYACGPWCQGPVLPQALNILETYDLRELGHNSSEYLHLVVSALDAAFADRHAYYGDPDFVRVPINGLLDKGYAATWRERIDQGPTWTEMPSPGDPWAFEPQLVGAGSVGARPQALRIPPEPDTSYCCAVDRWGNGFSATPSDGCRSTPLLPGLGFCLSPRGYQSWVDESHPARIEPGKRPRLTPSPALVLKDGRLEMVLGSPGHDVQPQAMLQVLLGMIEFGMDPQAAIEQPRVASYNYPTTGHPHPYHPGVVRAEGRIPAQVLDGLRDLGHTVEPWPDWIGTAGAPCVIRTDREQGMLQGGADPRRMSYVVGW